MWKLTIYSIQFRDDIEHIDHTKIEVISFQSDDLEQCTAIIQMFEEMAIKGNGYLEYTINSNKID